MNAEAVKILIAVIVSIVLAALITLGSQHYMSLREQAAQGQQRGETLKTTSGVIGDIGRADVERARVDVVVSNARDTYMQEQQEVEQNEPSIRDRADRPIPDSLRELARKRRIERERSGRALVGSEGERETTDTAER